MPSHSLQPDAALPDAAPQGAALPVALGPAAAIGLPPRQLAWRVLEAVSAGGYADAVLERELRRSSLSPRDRSLATELSYGSIRQRLLLDAWLDAHGRLPASRQPPRLRWLLHLGLYQLLFLSSVPPSAALSTSVGLARNARLGRLSGVVNAVLRSVQRRRLQLGLGPADPPWLGLPLPADAAASLSLRRSLPLPLARDLLLWRSPAQAEAFAVACNRPPPLDLRIQPLRCSRAAALQALQEAGIDAQPLAELPQGLSLPGRRGDPSLLPGYASGHWSVQDRSAQRIAPLLDPHPGQRLLDACAAPGGKTTHLAELLADDAELWALDRSDSRLRRLRSNAERLGLRCIRTLQADASGPLPQLPGRFDRILIDAPCSGLGTLSRHADSRWRCPDLPALLALQAQLLDNLAPLLAPDGLLLYATCSVDPRENGQQLEAFLQRHPGWSCRFAQQWWPGDDAGGDGFYAALLAPAAAPGPQGSGGGAATGGGGGGGAATGAGVGAGAAAGAGATTGDTGTGA